MAEDLNNEEVFVLRQVDSPRGRKIIIRPIQEEKKFKAIGKQFLFVWAQKNDVSNWMEKNYKHEQILSTFQNENEPCTRSVAFVIGLSYVEHGLSNLGKDAFFNSPALLDWKTKRTTSTEVNMEMFFIPKLYCKRLNWSDAL